MNNSRKVFGAIAMAVVFAAPLTAVAQNGCAPGQTSTPPCASDQGLVVDSALPGQTSTPPAPESIDIISLAEIGLRSLLLF